MCVPVRTDKIASGGSGCRRGEREVGEIVCKSCVHNLTGTPEVREKFIIICPSVCVGARACKTSRRISVVVTRTRTDRDPKNVNNPVYGGHLSCAAFGVFVSGRPCYDGAWKPRSSIHAHAVYMYVRII